MFIINFQLVIKILQNRFFLNIYIYIYICTHFFKSTREFEIWREIRLYFALVRKFVTKKRFAIVLRYVQTYVFYRYTVHLLHLLISDFLAAFH